MANCIKCETSLPVNSPFCPKCESIQVLAPSNPVAFNSASTWHRDGITFLEDGRFDRAVTAFTHAINTDSENLESYRGRAAAYRGLNQEQPALLDEARVKARSRVPVIRIQGVQGQSYESVKLDLHLGARFVRFKRCTGLP